MFGALHMAVRAGVLSVNIHEDVLDRLMPDIELATTSNVSSFPLVHVLLLTT